MYLLISSEALSLFVYLRALLIINGSQDWGINVTHPGDTINFKLSWVDRNFVKESDPPDINYIEDHLKMLRL